MIEEQLNTALGIAERHRDGKFSQEYRSLFKELWNKHAGATGFVISVAGIESFAAEMVDAGWDQWNLDSQDRSTVLSMFKDSGMPLYQFAEFSENESFDPKRALAEVALVTPAHREWQGQGGDAPSAPCTVTANPLQVIDWSKPRQEVIKEIQQVLPRDGFFCLINHGLDGNVAPTMEVAKEFFARLKDPRHREEQVSDIRVRQSMRPMLKTARGYTDMYGEALNVTQGPDTKESFDYGLVMSADKEQGQTSGGGTTCQAHLGENLWPIEGGTDDALAPPGFKKTCEEYIDETYKLARNVLELICEAFDIPWSEVAPIFEQPLVANRLLRYPSKFPEDKKGLGCGSHVDYGALTLVTEDCRGLEVELRGRSHSDQDGWMAIPHIPDAFIVNTGFVLEKLTNGLIRATRHRVQNAHPEGQDRHVLALFLDPNPDAMIGPLPSMLKNGQQPIRYETCVAGHKGVKFGYPTYDLEKVQAIA